MRKPEKDAAFSDPQRPGAVAANRARTIPPAVWVASALAVGFGLLTIKEGGTVLFGPAEARRAAGNYVPFVLWFNFLAGFAYVVAAVALWRRRRWAFWLSASIAAATALVFAAFGVHALAGGAYEVRTVVAMSLRTLVWVMISAVAWRALPRVQSGIAPPP